MRLAAIGLGVVLMAALALALAAGFPAVNSLEHDPGRTGGSGAAQRCNSDPDDLQGNLDDEDAGQDEEDGSNEDEPDEPDTGDESSSSSDPGSPESEGGPSKEDAGGIGAGEKTECHTDPVGEKPPGDDQEDEEGNGED